MDNAMDFPFGFLPKTGARFFRDSLPVPPVCKNFSYPRAFPAGPANFRTGPGNFKRELHELTRICFVPEGRLEMSRTHCVWQIVNKQTSCPEGTPENIRPASRAFSSSFR
jgi:hypothetical protein